MANIKNGVIELELNSSFPVNCLNLTILEMNVGSSAVINQLYGRHKPPLAMHSTIMQDWIQNTPDFGSYCDNKIKAQNFPKDMMECRSRNVESLYSFTSGFACQCDALCIVFGDCCNDFEEDLIGPNSVTNFQDVELYCISTEASNNPSREGLGFYLIISCLKEYSNSSIVSMCMFPHHDNDDIRLYIPVEVNGLVYRNAYCALCNNEPLSQGQFWNFGRNGGIMNFCDEYLLAVHDNLSDTRYNDAFECDLDGFFYPRKEALSGSSRVGKFCSLNHKNSLKDDPTLPMVRSYPTYVLMQVDKIEVIDNECFCNFCHENIYPYLTSATSHTMKYFSNYSGPLFFKFFFQFVDHSGALANIFRSIKPKFIENKAVKDSATEENFTFVVVSLVGSGSSILSILGILAHMIFVNGFNTKPRRCQLGIFVGKLIFYCALCCGTSFRHIDIACKFFSVLVHYGMLASFSHMTWFGIKVAYMMWELNHNMAELHHDNQNQKMDGSEVFILLTIWLGSLSGVISLWAYDQFVDDSLVIYGQNEICLLSGKMGRIYFVVVPAVIMVTLNTGSLFFSIFQFKKLFEDKSSQIVWTRLVSFLGKLIVLQSLQWVFGIVYFFTESSAAGHAFEILTAFEGTYMAISYFFSYLRKYIGV